MTIKSNPSNAVFLSLCLLLISNVVFSQQRRSINYTEISTLIYNNSSLTAGSAINGFRTRTGISKLLDKNFGLGLAIGTDNYRKSGGGNYNTLPLTVNASYYLDPTLNGLKLDAYGGYAVKLFNNLSKGFTAGAGISYALPINGGLNLGLQTGYNYQKIDFPTNFQLSENFNIGTLRLGLGITFK